MIVYSWDNNHITFEDNYIPMKDMHDYYRFVISDYFDIFKLKVFKLLKRKRNFENLDITKLFQDAGLFNSDTIKLSNTVLSFEKMMISQIIFSVEDIVGTIMLNSGSFKNFQECIAFRSVFTSISEFYYDRYLVNFTNQQHKESVIVLNEFRKNIDLFKQYLKLIKEV